MAESWGQNPTDFLGEPKKVFVNWLIWTGKMIEIELYMGGRISHAIEMMLGIINKLDDSSFKKLKPQYDLLLKYEQNTHLITSKEELRKVNREISHHLHNTYLKETYYAKPMRPSKGRMEIPE